MPYVKKEQREKYEVQLRELGGRLDNIGDFTYVIYSLCLRYVRRNPMGICYSAYAHILGALTGVIQELYRKEVAEYEDEKEEMNGEIRV